MKIVARGNITITDLNDTISATLDKYAGFVQVSDDDTVVVGQTVSTTVSMWMGRSSINPSRIKVFDSVGDELTAINNGPVSINGNTVTISFTKGSQLKLSVEYTIKPYHSSSESEREVKFTVIPQKIKPYSLKPSITSVQTEAYRDGEYVVYRVKGGGQYVADLTCGYVKNINGTETVIADSPQPSNINNLGNGVDDLFNIYFRRHKKNPDENTDGWSNYYLYKGTSWSNISQNGININTYDKWEWIITPNKENSISVPKFIEDSCEVIVTYDGRPGDNGQSTPVYEIEIVDSEAYVDWSGIMHGDLHWLVKKSEGENISYLNDDVCYIKYDIFDTYNTFAGYSTYNNNSYLFDTDGFYEDERYTDVYRDITTDAGTERIYAKGIDICARIDGQIVATKSIRFDDYRTRKSGSRVEISPYTVDIDHDGIVLSDTTPIYIKLIDGNNHTLNTDELSTQNIIIDGDFNLINASKDTSSGEIDVQEYWNEGDYGFYTDTNSDSFFFTGYLGLDENEDDVYGPIGFKTGDTCKEFKVTWYDNSTPRKVIAEKQVFVSKEGAPGPQGPKGDTGELGASGKVGKAYFLVGNYENKEYTSDEYQTPVVHIVNNEGKDEWHCLVADSNRVAVSVNPITGVTQYRIVAPKGDTTTSISGSDVITIWKKAFTEYDVVMTKAIFADFASLGSALVYGDFLFSKHGTVGTTLYTDSNPNYVADRPAYLRFCGGSENYNRTFKNRSISVTPDSEYRTIDLITFEATEGEILGGHINCTKVSGSAVIGIAVRKDDGTILWDGDISFASTGSGDIYEIIYDAEGEEIPEFTSDGVYTLYATVSNNTTASYNISGNVTLTGGAFIPNWYVDLRTGNMSAAKGKFKVEGDQLIVNDITATGGTFNNITAEGGTFTDIIVNGSIISNRLGKYTINYDAHQDMIYVKDGNTYNQYPLYSLTWWADDAPVPNYVIIDYNGYGAINLEHHTEDCYVELPCPRNSVGKKITIFVRRVNEYNAGTTIGANIILVSGYDHATETWSSFADYCRDFETGQCVKFDSRGSGVEAYAKVELISDGYNWIVVTSDRDITTFFDETMKYYI